MQCLIFNVRKRKSYMKIFKHITAFLLAVSFLPVFSVAATSETTDVASGKEVVNSGTNTYVLDLGRAYPVCDVQLSGVSTSSAQVMMSNDNDFPKASSGEVTNIAVGKPIRSKLYGDGGYTEDYAAKYAVDGNSSTQFISTPAKDSIEWLTIDLEKPAVIDNITLDFSANRTYTVSVTNTQYGSQEEFDDGIELKKSGNTNKFILPDEYVDSAFRYVRLRFDGDAPSDNYLDVNMYVREIAVNGFVISEPETLSLTTTFLKNGSVFTPNKAAEGNFYRYIKIRRVSKKPTVIVNVKKELADCINVATGADITMPDGADIYDDCSLDNVNDEDYSTITALNHHNPYIQLDLHKKRAISHVEVYPRQDELSDRDNIKILLSNSPDFDDYVILGEKFLSEEIGICAAFVRSRNNILDSYRYVRVYEGDTFLALSEIKVFANSKYDDLYNVAENVWPTADINQKVSYRSTDKDVKSFWKGNTLTINLDRCYAVNGFSITASGNIKITYGCNNGTQVSYTDTFENAETKNILFDKNISTLKLETADLNSVKVYNVGVYAKEKNIYINEIKPESVEQISGDCNIIDLGRTVIIDHIEPCNLSFDVSEADDFDITNTVTGCQPAPVGARYIKVPSGTDIKVIGYNSPTLINAKEEKSVEFDKEIYADTLNSTAVAAVYDNGVLKTASFDYASDGRLELATGDKASFMVWDGIVSMKPVLPKCETVYVNKIPQAEFYVDPDVDVSGNGTEDSPFKTIYEAQNAVRAINGSMTGDIVVNLKGGKYYLDKTLAFNNLDSGTNGYRVIYKNAEGETPVLTGGKPITGFKEGDYGIWYATASDFDSIYDLMVNGEVCTMAKTETPIHAEAFYSNATEYIYDGISFSKENLPMLSNPRDVFVHVTRSWMDVLLKVTGANEEDGLINLDILQPRFDDVAKDGALSGHQVMPSSSFYIENALELLDNPGEFYFDKGTKVLYYMPRSGEDMTTATVEAAVLDDIITIKGKNKYNHIENLTISGIRVENSTFERMYKYGYKTAQAQVITYDSPVFIDGAIQIDYASNIEISDCEITGLTKPAISMHNGVLDTKICNNRIYNVGDSAIVVGSQFHHAITGANELTERVTVSDNIVHKTGQKHKGAPAIACYYVIDVDVIHNKITDSNYSGISLGWGWNNYPDSATCRNNTVSKNYIENVNLVATDGGPIYTLGNQPGTVIEGNYIVQSKMPEQKTGISGIYPDEGSAYITIRNNVIDMEAIKDYSDNVRDISIWTSSIKDIYAHDNYSVYTNSRNNGTNCVVETPYVYARGEEPEAVKKIIVSSAINLR